MTGESKIPLSRVLGTAALLLISGTLVTTPALAQQEESIFDTISDFLESSSRSAGPTDYGAVSPSEVFQSVADLTAEIEILREELGVYDYPPEAELTYDRMPVHVYAKSLELLQKIARVQNRLGVSAGETRQIPFKEIVPSDVLSNVEYIIAELRRIKTQMAIEREITPAPLVAGKTPSLVYQALASASLLLDGLQGRQLGPNDVFLNCARILDEMEFIATKLRVSLDLDFPEVEGTKRSKDVAQQVLRATYKVINLQTKLGMDASAVPNITLVRVTPTEVFDATNMLLAEFARIKLHLEIDLPRNERPEAKGRTPTDVFGVVLIIIRNLDKLTAAA